MEHLKAHFSKDGKEYPDGLHDLECPICKSLHKELEIEHYCEENSDRYIECCTDCRETFEQDTGNSLDSDTLDIAVFTHFLIHSHESMDIEELKIEKVTRETNRSKWKQITGQDGFDEGFEYTTAVWHFPCGCWFEEFENYGKTEYQVTIGNHGWIEETPEAIAKHLHYWHSGEHKQD